jgi:pimeloyl-ACP methyl ester carboxylesterase
MFFFQLPALPETVFRLFSRRIVERTFRGLAVRKEAFTDVDLRRFREALEKPGALTAALNYYRATFRNFSALRELAHAPTQIGSPTLVIWGENDVALGKELTYGMEPLIRGPFRIEYVRNCSHWVNEEQPELVNRLLLEFLDGRQAT